MYMKIRLLTIIVGLENNYIFVHNHAIMNAATHPQNQQCIYGTINETVCVVLLIPHRAKVSPTALSVPTQFVY